MSDTLSVDAEENIAPELNQMRLKLGNVCVDLNSLKCHMEEEFLEIGSSLRDFNSRTGEMSRISSSVARLLMADEIVSSTTEFDKISDMVNAYLKRAETETKKYGRKLQSILKTIIRANKPLGDLKDIAKLLKILGVSTRIVTAKLSRHDKSFIALTENIKNLSNMINSRSSDILSRLKSLTNRTHETIGTLESLAERQRKLFVNVRENINKGRQSLVNISNKCSGLAETTAVVTEKSGEISAGINDITVSMQLHDIKGQEVEQAKNEIDKVCRTISGDEAANIDHLMHVCSFQQQNLASIRSDLISAVNVILGNLNGIARNVVDISAEISQIAGSVCADFSHFWNDMEQVMTSLTSSIQEDTNTSCKLSETMVTVAGTVGETSQFVGDIDVIGSDLKLIAQNTRIKAAHLGNRGAELSILAKRMGELPKLANEQTRIISEILNKVSLEAQEIFEREEANPNIMNSGLDEMAFHLVDIVDPLRQIDEKINVLLERMDGDSSSLADAIKDSVNRVSLKDGIFELIGSSESTLEKIEFKARILACRKAEKVKTAVYQASAETRGSKIVNISEYNSRTGNRKEKISERKTGEFGENVELF